MGIASYGYLAKKLDKKKTAEKYMQKAKNMAKKWMKMANDGDHYRLTFDRPGTWSQKYNLIWNKLLKTDSKTHVGFQARSVVGGFYIKMLKDKLDNAQYNKL